MSLFNNFVPFKRDLQLYLGKCKKAFDETKNHSASRRIESFLCDFESQRYNLAIIGSLNRGKSTLLNSLMERRDDHISPIRFEVCTSAIIRYFDKNLETNKEHKEKAIIYFFDSDKHPIDVDLSRLHEYITEAGNPKNSKGVKSVEVYGDFPEWSKAVTIVDTPGQNSIYNHHDTLLVDFLPYTDAIIFLVAADIPLDSGDIALLKELAKEKKKIFFVLTKIDELDNPDDVKIVRDHVMKNIKQQSGIDCDKLYEISAKPVFDALTNNTPIEEVENLKAKNGILTLEHDLEEFIVKNSDQTAVLKARIKSILTECRNSCEIFCETTEAILKRDGFDIVKMSSEKDDLLNANKKLRKETKKALRKFEREWSRALNRFSRKFAAKGSKVDDQIMETLHKGGFIGALFTSFKLTKKIEKIIRQELGSIALELEDKLQDIIENLNNELDEEVNVYIKSRQRSDLLTPAGSVIAASLLGATTSCAWGVSTTAATAANTSLTAWLASITPAATGQAGNIVKAININTYANGGVWGVTKGFFAGPAFTTAATNATNTGAVAIGNTTILGATPMIMSVASSIISIGASIAVTYIVQKILHFGLKGWQGARIPAISEKIITEMENEVFKGLDIAKTEIIESYTQMIEDVINGNLDRLEDIEEVLSEHNPEKIAELEDRLQRVKALIPQADDLISKQLLLG